VPIEDAAARRPVAPQAAISSTIDDPAAVQSSFRRTDAARGSMKVMERYERGRNGSPCSISVNDFRLKPFDRLCFSIVVTPSVHSSH